MSARRIVLGWCLASLLVTGAGWAQGSTPQAISVQGRLSQGGVPANGVVQMVFRLFDDPFAGAMLSSLGPLPVDVSNGLYQVDVPFPVSGFAGPNRFVEVVVNGQTLAPRLRLGSAPYAYVAESLDGLDSSSFLLGTGDTATGTLVLSPASGAALVTTGGNVGIGTSNPTSPLEVAGLVSSTSGGFRFPDGSVLATASLASGVTLEQAYNKGGAGAGRTITASSGAVNVAGTGGLTVNGNVGVGTVTPTQKLEVAGTIYSSTGGFRFPDGTTLGSAGLAAGVTLDQAYRKGGAGAGRTITADGGAVNVAGAGGLTVNGNVGIGTTSPSDKLTVAGTVRSTSGGFEFPDGTTQTTAATTPPAATYAVCVNFSGTNCTTIYCSCGTGTQITRVPSTCTVTSDTGSCTAQSFSCLGGGVGFGTCCVCRP